MTRAFEFFCSASASGISKCPYSQLCRAPPLSYCGVHGRSDGLLLCSVLSDVNALRKAHKFNKLQLDHASSGHKSIVMVNTRFQMSASRRESLPTEGEVSRFEISNSRHKVEVSPQIQTWAAGEDTSANCKIVHANQLRCSWTGVARCCCVKFTDR